ncbi:fructose-1,6-bisphosphatase [Anopheles sinensis]|uniref:Fructose-1,6-bisphosphatase n=1 Tax=Anopheles sinensis TaxID=74873 RepID=A0A084VEN0_ANOSI|nr:fructose-1,6-bisphosphatase [Anopheles sinensis]
MQNCCAMTAPSWNGWIWRWATAFFHHSLNYPAKDARLDHRDPRHGCSRSGVRVDVGHFASVLPVPSGPGASETSFTFTAPHAHLDDLSEAIMPSVLGGMSMRWRNFFSRRSACE